MPKRKTGVKATGGKRSKHGKDLEIQLRDDADAAAGKLVARRKAPTRREGGEDGAGVDERQEKRVMALAQAQQSEEQQREELEEEEAAAERARVRFAEESDEESEVEEGSDVSDVDATELLGNGEVLSVAQSRLVESFMNPHARARRTLADIIMEKIAEKEVRGTGGDGGDRMNDDDDGEPELPAKVVECYSGMAKILGAYRSGKLPKAFKVIPSLERWEEVLWLTRPDEWSPHCVEVATKIFASNMDPKRATSFYEEILLQRCRDDIRANKRLNYHLYQALHRALFKPAPWFKGILLPLAKSGDASLREALIISSVLAKASVPAAHAAVVLLKLAETTLRDYSGAISIFVIVLLNKKYALPVRVVDALVKHFLNFTLDDRDLPVLWHQALLVFTQRYHMNLTDAHREALGKLLKKHTHAAITPDIRRELQAPGPKRQQRTK